MGSQNDPGKGYYLKRLLAPFKNVIHNQTFETFGAYGQRPQPHGQKTQGKGDGNAPPALQEERFYTKMRIVASGNGRKKRAASQVKLLANHPG